ncbi:DUF268 domain-containing protein [Methylibium sp.]|uniref:DUF268 domain-containing protein n=1 Tax=Methylibium sp. TaxID=2067992 RepID=UPI0018402D3B|nr:DUF268 domain-containing protein [Methylibium sp.]MBA3588108.1 DUF268 domain-containing protein [Methylibium sp.]
MNIFSSMLKPTRESLSNKNSKEEAFFSLSGKYQRLIESLASVRAASGAAYVPPPEHMPLELRDEFMMQGRAEIIDWYLNNKPDPKSLASLVMYRKPLIAQTRKDIAQRKYKSYGATNDHLRSALTYYPIKNRFVLIVGSAYPQYECFCLNAGARPVTVEYNVRFSDSDDLTFFSPAQFDALGVKGEGAIAISSYEHDGLGRYGDPVDPTGDLKSMRKLQSQLEPGSLAYISVPIGRDTVVWNAHRIYGRHRLPMLFDQWEVVSCFGDSHQLLEVKNGMLVVDPEKWDSHFAPSRSRPEWVFVLRAR